MWKVATAMDCGVGLAVFHGVYINLDRRLNRRTHLQDELARFGLGDKYRRLRAIPDANPAVGCYRSHMKALEEARRIGGIVHILEDDSILSAELAPFLEGRAAELLTQYDIIFLDMWVDQEQESVDKYQAAMDRRAGVIPLGAHGPRIGATSSYVVAPGRLARLHRLLRRQASKGLPIDTTFDNLVRDGECSAAVVVPFLTGVDLVHGTVSDIQPIPSRDQRMFVALRTRFFVDRGRQPSF